MRKHSILKILSIAFGIILLVLTVFPILLPNEFNNSIQVKIEGNQSQLIWRKINDSSDWQNWYVGFENLSEVSLKIETEKAITMNFIESNLATKITVTLTENKLLIHKNCKIPYFKRYFGYSKKSKQDLQKSVKNLKERI